MTRIVCVHGTNAGDAQDEGPRWWQRGSPFQLRLCAWLGLDPSQFEPFHWGDGPNSELERRKAGLALLKRLRTLEAENQDYVLLGHSHGGSVIHHALLQAAGKRQQLPHLRRWITIGTPFIWMRPHRFLFRRLSNTAKIAFVYAIFGFFGLLTFVPTYYYYGRDMLAASAISMGQPALPVEMLDLQLTGMMLLVPLMSLLLIAMVLWSQRRLRWFYSKKGRAFFKAEFIPRWQPFWSRADEAINALRATGPMKLSLFKRNILTEPAKSAVVLAVALFVLVSFTTNLVLLARYGVSTDYVVHSYASMSRLSLLGVPQPDLTGIHENPVDVRGVFAFAALHPILIASMLPLVALEVGLAFLMLTILFGAVHWIAFLLGIPAAMFLNRITADRLRDAAFGNDTRGEQVLQVAPVPQDCDTTFAHLPDDVEQPLSAFCAAKAAVTLERVREVLGVSEQLSGKTDIAATIAKELSSYELIHVAYFEVEEFSRLVAGALQPECAAPVAPSRLHVVA
jgi:hypothetical protein